MEMVPVEIGFELWLWGEKVNPQRCGKNSLGRQTLNYAAEEASEHHCASAGQVSQSIGCRLVDCRL